VSLWLEKIRVIVNQGQKVGGKKMEDEVTWKYFNFPGGEFRKIPKNWLPVDTSPWKTA